MPLPVEYPEDLVVALALQRGLALDAARAAALRPVLESLLARLARLGGTLPAEVAPPGDREP
jgi:hypothetical protein